MATAKKPTVKQRLETELKALNENLAALEKFLKGKAFEKLDRPERSDLKSQRAAMAKYAKILTRRISRK